MHKMKMRDHESAIDLHTCVMANQLTARACRVAGEYVKQVGMDAMRLLRLPCNRGKVCNDPPPRPSPSPRVPLPLLTSSLAPLLSSHACHHPWHYLHLLQFFSRYGTDFQNMQPGS